MSEESLTGGVIYSYVTRNVQPSRFNGFFLHPVKLVHACLSAGRVLGSIFHHCDSPVNLVQACLSTWKD